MKLYLGLDLGTTGCKAVLMDDEMTIRVSASCPSPLRGTARVREFDADEFCDTVFGLIREVTAQYGSPASHIRALCPASASGNTVFLDERYSPLCPAVSWTDRRIEGQHEHYLPGFDLDGVYGVTGWPYIGMFPLAHLAWMKHDQPDLWARCRFICMSTEYLLYRMCGKWGLDTSSATTFYLQDQLTGDYCKEYLDYFGLTRNMLPPILPSKTVLGSLLPETCARTGLSADTKVVLGSFDHPACARGMGALDIGDLLISCGTSWAGLYVSDERDAAIEAGMLVVPFLRNEGEWACIFPMTQYGEYIDARIRRFIDDSPARFELFNTAAMSACRKDAVFCDITDESACETAWASLDKSGIAYSLMVSACAEVSRRVQQMRLKGFAVRRVFMAGGPSSSPIWPQILADSLDCEVYCLYRMYGGATGAALMAAVGEGSFADERAFFTDKKMQYTVYTPKGGASCCR